MYAFFSNDAYVGVKLPNHYYSEILARRNDHERIFRQIHTYLILRGIINKNILDSGSWIGDNTIPWALNIFGGRKVFAIDPSKNNLAFTNLVARTNNISNVITLETALSDREETISTDDDLHHANFSKGGEMNKISANTLDYFYSCEKIYDIDFMHLDVESMEYKVILGGEKLITELQPIITFEQHIETEDYMLIANHLKDRGYSVYIINEILLGCYPDCRNLLALPGRIKEKYPNLEDEIVGKIGYDCLIPL